MHLCHIYIAINVFMNFNLTLTTALYMSVKLKLIELKIFLYFTSLIPTDELWKYEKEL